MSNILTIKDKIVLFPLWLLTLLPLRVLHMLSDFLFLITYYILGYRKKVVLQNLHNSFPDKDEKELKRITIKFYHYLCDYFLESVYLINMSEKECNRRYKYKNIELVHRLASEKRSIILATGHFGNWDWTANFTRNFPYKFYGVYKPITNQTFDRLFIDMRAKYGGFSTPLLHTLRVVIDSIKKNELFALYLAADQRPLQKDLDYWTTFLNQETPILTGMEKLAKRFDLPVVFFNLKRVKRGYYEIDLELITEDPKTTETYEITDNYVHRLEKMILAQPEYYLWSHKRWKYDPKIFNPKPIAE